ncbi:hypothetical protein ACFV1N_13770 [Streptosporangium canum]|uniref:hypothetical protein n=1 Tax=Streptosporangium canum TaxID=324952 RepID=UPI0036868359
MGHDNEWAALRYQHRSAKGDRFIADGLDALVRAERDQDGGGRWCRWPNGPAVKTTGNDQGLGLGIMSLARAFCVERVTGIEPALSAWEVSIAPGR